MNETRDIWSLWCRDCVHDDASIDGDCDKDSCVAVRTRQGKCHEPSHFKPKPAPTPALVVDHCSPKMAKRLQDAGLLAGHVWQPGDKLEHSYCGEMIFLRDVPNRVGWIFGVKTGGDLLMEQCVSNCLYLPSTAWLLAEVRARHSSGEVICGRAVSYIPREGIPNGFGNTDPDRLASLLLKLVGKDGE